MTSSDAERPRDADWNSGPLRGIRVLDIGQLLAGPFCASILADFGADVIKIERSSGDPLRQHGYHIKGHGLWWKQMARNKRCITLNLTDPHGRDAFLALVDTADVIVENYRPGVLESWNLGYDVLSERNPGIVLLRTSGFGQFGPYKDRAGFGTIAEAMSGFAHITGPRDGPPTLPPFGLADGIAGLSGAIAVLMALYHRDGIAGATGRGQQIDLAIVEPIVTILGAQATVYDKLGIVQNRNGNRTEQAAPRNIYQTRDGVWLAVSTSTAAIQERVMKLVGRPDLVPIPTSLSLEERQARLDAIDEAVAEWFQDLTGEVAEDQLVGASAAVARIYSIADVVGDPQFRALETVVHVNDEDLGNVAMTNLLFRLSETPGAIRFAGQRLGESNEAIVRELGDRLDGIDLTSAGLR